MNAPPLQRPCTRLTQGRIGPAAGARLVAPRGLGNVARFARYLWMRAHFAGSGAVPTLSFRPKGEGLFSGCVPLALGSIYGVAEWML